MEDISAAASTGANAECISGNGSNGQNGDCCDSKEHMNQVKSLLDTALRQRFTVRDKLYTLKDLATWFHIGSIKLMSIVIDHSCYN